MSVTYRVHAALTGALHRVPPRPELFYRLQAEIGLKFVAPFVDGAPVPRGDSDLPRAPGVNAIVLPQSEPCALASNGSLPRQKQFWIDYGYRHRRDIRLYRRPGAWDSLA